MSEGLRKRADLKWSESITDKVMMQRFGLFLTGGDIFPNAFDSDGRTFDPIPVGVFNYSLDSSMDLFQRPQKTFIVSAQYIHRFLITENKVEFILVLSSDYIF